MVLRITLAVSRDGLLRRFEATGHAGADLGRNIACAAATVLLRTAGRECTARGIVESGSADQPGEMAMALNRSGRHAEWLRGVTDFLRRGMGDLQKEFPDKIALRVETTED